MAAFSNPVQGLRMLLQGAVVVDETSRQAKLHLYDGLARMLADVGGPQLPNAQSTPSKESVMHRRCSMPSGPAASRETKAHLKINS
jgi:hypothetical protein